MSVPPVSKKNAAQILLVLSLASFFPPLATDMYLPTLGELGHYMHAPETTMEISVSVFFLGLGIGQLILGPIIDRMGRKKPLLYGTALFCITTIMIIITHSASFFLVLRFLQALGACTGIVIGRAVVQDLFQGKDAERKMSILLMLSAFGPIISPLLGGLLASFFPWQSVFITMLVIGVATLVLACFFLPESLPKSDRTTSSYLMAFNDYFRLCKDWRYCLPAIMAAFIMSCLFSYITASSHVLQNIFGLSKIGYGIAFGIFAAGLVIASWLNGRLLKQYNVASITQAANITLVIAAIVLFLVTPVHSLLLLGIPLWISIALIGMLISDTSIVTMENTGSLHGSGSALLGGLQFGVSFLCSSIVGSHITSTPRPMALGILIPSIVAMVLWLIFRKLLNARNKKGEHAQEIP